MQRILLDVPFEIIKGAEPYIINPFTSQIEKAILEFGVMLEAEHQEVIFRNALRLLKCPEDLPLKIKMAWVYKAREISFGGDLRLRYKCAKCKQITESVIILEKLLKYPYFDNLPEDLQMLPLVKKPTFQEIQNVKVSRAASYFGLVPQSLQEATKYAIALKARLPTMKESLPCKCLFCHHEKLVNIVNPRFCVDTLSEHNPTTMIQTYNILAANGFGKLDVDSMLPFEREVHLRLIEAKTKQIKEQNKNANKVS